MKLFLFTTLILFFSNCLIAADAGVVDFRIGDLFVKKSNVEEWLAIDEEDSVFVGDTLKTGVESKCEILLNDKSIIRMSQNTVCVINLYENKKDAIKFRADVSKGEIWCNVNKKDKSARDFKVKTPIAVAAVIGTNYKISYDGENSSISVLEGKVKVNLSPEKKEELNLKPEKRKSFTPKKSHGPKEINGPKEVTLKEWLEVVRGEVISVNSEGKYLKSQPGIEVLTNEWDNFRKKE